MLSLTAQTAQVIIDGGSLTAHRHFTDTKNPILLHSQTQILFLGHGPHTARIVYYYLNGTEIINAVMVLATRLTDDDIVRALGDEGDEDYADTNKVVSDSIEQNEDGLQIDNVESDFHDEPSDTEDAQESRPLDIEEEVTLHCSPPSANCLSGSNYIIHMTQPNIRGKNRQSDIS